MCEWELLPVRYLGNLVFRHRGTGDLAWEDRGYLVELPSCEERGLAMTEESAALGEFPYVPLYTGRTETSFVSQLTKLPPVRVSVRVRKLALRAWGVF
jgi:hypothetical protein